MGIWGHMGVYRDMYGFSLVAKSPRAPNRTDPQAGHLEENHKEPRVLSYLGALQPT